MSGVIHRAGGTSASHTRANRKRNKGEERRGKRSKKTRKRVVLTCSSRRRRAAASPRSRFGYWPPPAPPVEVGDVAVLRSEPWAGPRGSSVLEDAIRPQQRIASTNQHPIRMGAKCIACHTVRKGWCRRITPRKGGRASLCRPTQKRKKKKEKRQTDHRGGSSDPKTPLPLTSLRNPVIDHSCWDVHGPEMPRVNSR